MLELEEILTLTARGVANREAEDRKLLQTEIERNPEFKILWDHIETKVRDAASKGMYYCSLRNDELPPYLPYDIHKISRVLHSAGFSVDHSRMYLTIRWASDTLATDRLGLIFRLKYGKPYANS